MTFDIKEYIAPIWHRPIGGFAAAIASFVSTLLLFQCNGEIPHPVTALLVSVLPPTIVGAVWLSVHRIPKPAKGRVGIVIAIRGDTPEETQRVRTDFVTSLQNSLAADHRSSTFDVRILPQFATAMIDDSDTAKTWLLRSRSHLILWGISRLRTINGKPSHLLRVNALIRHATVTASVGAELAKEITDALPRTIEIPADNDALTFEFTSSLFDVAARYIIALAAMVSQDLPYAERLLLSVEVDIGRLSAGIPNIQAIAKGAAKWLLAIYKAWLIGLNRAYNQTRNSDFLTPMQDIAAKLLRRDRDNYQAHLAFAITAFANDRNVTSALEHVEACSHSNDCAWQLNRAFLRAYAGDLIGASSDYRSARRKEMNDATVAIQCEEFICNVLHVEPKRIGLHFCLGILNYDWKHDFRIAKEEFDRFLSRNPAGANVAAATLAKKLSLRCADLIKRRDGA